MFRTLIIVCVAGFVISAACLGGAFGLGGADVAKNGWNVHAPFWKFGWVEDYDWTGPPVTKEIPWSADRDLVFTHGGDIHFKQGPEHKMVVTGPSDLVNRLHMQDGRLDLDTGHFGMGGGHLNLDITAPDIDTFKIYGSSNLTIDEYDQERLQIEINGNGDVKAYGKAREADVTIRGSGDVDVSRIVSEEARVKIMGSGDTIIAPTDTADIDIAGSGDVTLMSDPPHVDTNIKGSGNIMHRPMPSTPTPPDTSTPPSAAPSAKPAKPI